MGVTTPGVATLRITPKRSIVFQLKNPALKHEKSILQFLNTNKITVIREDRTAMQSWIPSSSLHLLHREGLISKPGWSYLRKFEAANARCLGSSHPCSGQAGSPCSSRRAPVSDQGWGSHLPVPDPSLTAPAKPKYSSANSGAVSQ